MSARSLFLLLCVYLFWALLADSVQAEVIAITHAELYTMTAEKQPLVNATIVIRDDLIEAVGPDVSIPQGSRVIDAAGRIVTPGLISAASQLGLTEHSANSHNNDIHSWVNPVRPTIRAWARCAITPG